MGYYPTPMSVVERIGTFLSFPSQNVNLLDPCCGEGLALGKLAEGKKATTYGVELDGYRAQQAKGNLDHVLKCSYEDARISNGAFSCLFLNPPYDWETPREAETHGERTERAFLRGTIRYVQPEGVLVYIVPQPRVTDDVARILSFRFDRFSAYRFPDEEYEAFRQVVVLGAKKPRATLDDESFGRLRGIPGEDLNVLPYVDEPRYPLPPSPDVGLFRSTAMDEAELEQELMGSPLWAKLRKYGNDRNGRLGRPPLPLHAGHLGLLLASGYLDGVVGEGEDRHVVRGKVEKLTSKYEEYEGDTIIERQVERYQVSVKALLPDGEIMTLM